MFCLVKSRIFVCFLKYSNRILARKFVKLKMLLQNKTVANCRLLVKNVYKKLFSDFSTKTYVEGTQKICLNEMVLLSTQNTVKAIFTILCSIILLI